MDIYIRSSACISAQKTFGHDDFLQQVVAYHTSRLRAIEPDYSKYIDPKLIRRMSHIIKMGVAAARECLNEAGMDMPGAIITGTAYGCLEDTVTFLTRMIELNEELLPPTSFIQSTHNTVAAQIALQLKCHNYNNTFVHKGISFESALLDATMLLQEQEAESVLVGGTDEMTDTSHTILTRLGLFKTEPVANLSLLSDRSRGTVGGEGAVFFLLTAEGAEDNLAVLKGQQTFYKPKNSAEIEAQINAFLARNNCNIGDIDLVITGRNGDVKNDEVYAELGQSLLKNTASANYKHLCGEYPTSPAFALWLAANIIKKQRVPEVVKNGSQMVEKPRLILIYNHYFNTYHSLMLVSAC